MHKFKSLLSAATALAFTLGVAAPVSAQDAAPAGGQQAVAAEVPNIIVTGHAVIGDFGIDLTSRDTSTKPGDDFERYASGAWMDKTTIPADRPETGSFINLRDDVQTELQNLVTKAPAGTKYGALYSAFMNEKAVERAEGVREVSAHEYGRSRHSTGRPRRLRRGDEATPAQERKT